MSYLRSIFLLFSVLLAVSTQALSGPLNINTADAGALAEAIDGVGDRRAVAIVQYRETYGPFASVDELANVKGIGMKTVDNNRANLTVISPRP
ncbi:MAG: helix-hairpin-helix domain-containing protein [Gammaproteobacteria bacterium]|nr:helix-hairpin-helix domain-containing protein [Gammaproteobacteria bacterium]